MRHIGLIDEPRTRQEYELDAPAIAPSYIETVIEEPLDAFGTDPFDVVAHHEKLLERSIYTTTTTVTSSYMEPDRVTGTLHITRTRKTEMTTQSSIKPSRTFKLTTMADLARALPSYGAAYYCPMDHAPDLVRGDWAKANITSSLAWRLDNTLVNTSRSLFFALFQRMVEQGLVESYNEFLDAANGKDVDSVTDLIDTIKESKERDQNLREQGLTPFDMISSIEILLLLRQDWHARAMDVCGYTTGTSSLLGVRHNEPSLERLFLDQKAQGMTTETRGRMKTAADLTAADPETGVIDEELAENLFKSKEKRAMAQAIDQLESGQKRIPAMMNILHYIQLFSDRETATFSDLALDTRKKFVESMSGMFEILRSKGETTPARFLSSDDFEMLLTDCKRASRSIKQILARPEFEPDASEASIESQHMITANRRKSEEEEARAEGYVTIVTDKDGNEVAHVNLVEYRKHLRTLGRALHHPLAKPSVVAALNS